MFVDPNHLTHSDIHTELCVVGTGPAGLAIAREVGTARDVWLLEAGTLEDSELSQSCYQAENVGLPYFDLDRCRTRRFGGSSSCWGGYCRTFEELDFEVRPRIPHSGWPLTIADVWGFYERAHAICGLGPVNYEYDFWAKLSGQGPSPFQGPNIRPEIRQKSRFDLALATRALAASSNVHVCTQAAVTELITDEHGRSITGVVFRDPGGRKHTVRARRFVLAAGGIENARLLLASAGVQKQGIGNDRDLVGRFFMEHIDFDTGFFHPADPALFRHQLEWRPAAGTPIRNSLAVAEPIRRGEQLLRCFFHVGEQSVVRTYGFRSATHVFRQLRRGRPVRNVRYHWRNLLWDRKALLAAAQWRLHLRSGDPGATGQRGVLRLRVTAEPSPNPASRVTLSRDRDRFGLPKVRLDWRINPEDYGHVRRSLELFEQDARRLGLGHIRLKPVSKWPTRGTYHHMGTTRMSADPARGVVDADCRVHGLSNLYVAGSSVFPTAGSGTPTLMIVALALRLAEHLGREFSRDPVHATAGLEQTSFGAADALLPA